MFLILPPACAQNGIDTDLGGYIKELGQISLSNDLGTIRYDNILHHRIESEFKFAKGFEARADMRTRLLNGWTVRNSPNYAEFLDEDPGYFDLSHTWIDSDETILHSALDRLHLSYVNGPWEVHAGRQRINWGQTMVWNPNDLFNAFAYLDFDYEERPGTDAISIQYNWSYASSMDLAYRVGDSFEESVIGGMVRTSLGSYDVQFVGGHYLDYTVVGTGWTGYLKDAGLKGEATYFHPEDRFFKDTGHFTATAGVDHMLDSGIYLQGEFLYNGGYQQRSSPIRGLTRPPSADNLFIARSGLFLNGLYQIHPLVSGNLGFMGSFDRSIFILIPQLSVSVSDNVDFLVLSQLLKGNVLDRLTETPNLLYFRLKWSY